MTILKEAWLPKLAAMPHATGLCARLSAPSSDELQRALEIDTESARAIMLATTSMYTLLVSYADEGVAAVVKRALTLRWLSFADTEVAREFATVLLPTVEEVRRNISHRATDGDVIPDVEELSASIDVRLGFRSGSVAQAQPIVVFRLKVEHGGSVVFKMTTDQLDEVIVSLKEAQNNLQEASRWASSQSEARHLAEVQE